MKNLLHLYFTIIKIAGQYSFSLGFVNDYLGFCRTSIISSSLIWRGFLVQDQDMRFPPNIYVFQINNRKTRKSCEKFSKLTIKTKENVIEVVLVFLSLTLYIFHTFFYCFFCWFWTNVIRKNIFACLFSVHNTISLHVINKYV